MTTGKNRKPSPVDWELIKQRMAAAGDALESGFAPGAAQRQAILQARARALATDNTAPDPGPEIDVLEFMVGTQGYALEMQYVQEVHALAGLARLPCTPAFVRGIVNLHGRMMSVLDLHPLFGLPPKELSGTDKLVVLLDGRMIFGVLADAILGVQRLPRRRIQPPPSTATGIPDGWTIGITPERTVVLDAKRLLNDKSIVVDQEALS
jgi:purine-binding chemotaxis protein CheW